LRRHANTSNPLYMSNVDLGSSLRWMLASTMMKWHHFHSTSDLELQNLGPTVLCNDIRVHPYACETAYQYLKNFIHV
jgi:hypothetical protein